MFLAALPAFLNDNLQWIICLAIVVLGLVVYGFWDLIHLSARRIWAISSVVFAESYRRRVLLITPLAMIGVLIVSQLIKPFDEQDAIRQTIKFSLFATGLVITITAIILACTNLPKEIENRVIYTIVTKPTSRLEIVIGKVVGFARVSALILLIMGVFTFAYLHIRSWNFRRDIAARLQTPGAVDPTAKSTLEHYRDHGLLAARELETPSDLQVYSRAPQGPDGPFYLAANEGDFLVPFNVKEEDLIPPGAPGAAPGVAGLGIELHIGYERNPHAAAEAEDPNALPQTVAAPKGPQVVLQILDQYQNNLVPPKSISDGKAIELIDPEGKQPVYATISPEWAEQLANKSKVPLFYVYVSGNTPGMEYIVGPQPVTLIVPAPANLQPPRLPPASDSRTGKTATPIFRGRQGTAGQQVRGESHGYGPVAVYSFAGAEPRGGGDVPFEIRTGIERSGDESGDIDIPTRIQFTVRNRSSGKESPPIEIAVEANRQAFFGIPSDQLTGGNFDVLVRSMTDGHYIGLYKSSLSMVAARQSFDLNLAKSLLIMWLMSILVIAVAIFTSTFLSWPIAIVLTLVILLGHWGVEQLGDATQPGIGNLVAQDMGFRDPSVAKTVSASVEALSQGLRVLSSVLPDISQFAATEDIERGVAIPWSTMLASFKVLACYGLAALTLAYVSLRLKEVAP
jgi:ABC-type transport system involved in multi-copper enzyme maturation permease subunit